MSAIQIDADTLRKFHSSLASPQHKGFTDAQLHTLYTQESGKALPPDVTEDKFRSTIKLYEAIAPQVSADEFVAWQQTGELPVVKLTPQQMEQLHGGLLGSAVSGAMCVAVITLELVVIAAIAING
jgi:hypothetical protein